MEYSGFVSYNILTQQFWDLVCAYMWMHAM